MDAQKLVTMANQIAGFFESDAPDPLSASDGIASHLRRFWDPRMRRALLQWIDERGGEGCRPSVLAAVSGHRESLTPDP